MSKPTLIQARAKAIDDELGAGSVKVLALACGLAMGVLVACLWVVFS